jgi:hypothetical protein
MASPRESTLDYHDGYGERSEKCYSGAVYEVLRSMGYPDQILPRTIRPLDPQRPLAGRIFTVSGHADFTFDGGYIHLDRACAQPPSHLKSS